MLALDAKYDEAYRKAYKKEKSGYYLLCSVAYASAVALLGLTLLLLEAEIFPPNGEFPPISFGQDVEFPVSGSRLISVMAFLGAYIWGIQYVLRRYSLNDLVPKVYYALSIRMILAALVAVVIFNAYEAIPNGGASGGEGGLTGKIWPVLAFMLGMFPQRGVRWLTARLPLVSSEVSDAVREAPLEMIEGIESQDKVRLEELGIDSCYDLAMIDFVALILNTP